MCLCSWGLGRSSTQRGQACSGQKTVKPTEPLRKMAGHELGTAEGERGKVQLYKYQVGPVLKESRARRVE